MDAIAGLHHITAISSDPQRTLDFYTDVMGLRLVKLTVNFDDPGTYHFYFGDEVGSPGPPRFAIDETVEHLGERLMLPPWLEPSRGDLERKLPRLTRSGVSVPR